MVQGWRFAHSDLALYEECGRRFGNAFTLRLPGYPLVLFSSPEVARQIFTSARRDLSSGAASLPLSPLFGSNALPLLDGTRHARDRRILHGPLNGQCLLEYGKAMLAITDRVIDSWPLGQAFALEPQFHRITFDVLFQVVFGFDEEETACLGDRLRRRVALAPNPMWLWPPLQINLGSLTPWGRYVKAMTEVTTALIEVIRRHRRRKSAGTSSVLQALIEAQDLDGSALTDEELRDEMMTFLLAGYDTTATALTWAVYEIVSNPEVNCRLRGEIEQIADSGGLQPEQIMSLPYLDAVVKESLRIRPIIPMLARQALRPVNIGGWDIPKGVNVGPCIYLLHRRPDIWPEPERFDPDRFTNEARILDEMPDGNRVTSSAYKYLPFGGGDRRCIGMAFTLSQMKFILAQLVIRADLKLVPYKMRIKRRVMTFAPSEGLPVVVQRKTNSSPPLRRMPVFAAAGGGEKELR